MMSRQVPIITEPKQALRSIEIMIMIILISLADDKGPGSDFKANSPTPIDCFLIFPYIFY